MVHFVLLMIISCLVVMIQNANGSNIPFANYNYFVSDLTEL